VGIFLLITVIPLCQLHSKSCLFSLSPELLEMPSDSSVDHLFSLFVEIDLGTGLDFSATGEVLMPA